MIDIQTLKTFFMWCTIINGSILILSGLLFMFGLNYIYRIHSKWVQIPKDKFDIIFYSFLGVFKIFFLVFNAVPDLVLLIMG
jgi:hypothetical protein